MFGSLPFIWLTSSFEALLTELIMNAVLENLPFPINLIVTWRINPISLILQVVVFILLIILVTIFKRE